MKVTNDHGADELGVTMTKFFKGKMISEILVTNEECK